MIAAIILAYIAAVGLVLMFLAGAKRLSYSPAELAEDDERQYAWVCAQVNGSK